MLISLSSKSLGHAEAVHRIESDSEAIERARRLADRLRAGAIEPDSKSRPRQAAIDGLAASGLLAITVPKAYGGAGLSLTTLVEVTATLSQADASIGPILQNP